MENKNIAVCVLLSIVTCGIYSLYWYYTIAKTFYSYRTQASVSTSPGVTTLLYVLTCGIYGIYAAYQWGKATPEIFAQFGQNVEDKSVMYLLLSIFGLDIVNMCLIQNDFNQLSGTGTYQPPPAY